MFLKEKGVEYEFEPTNIMPVPEGYEKISPARRIPALLDRSVGENATLADSSVICAYLERKHPEPPLYPTDDFLYARALWFEEYADSELAGPIGMGAFRPIAFARFQKKEPDLDTARKTVSERLPPMFDYLEGELAGGKFLVNDQLSIADMAVANQLFNLELVVGKLDAGRWPGLADLVQRVVARPSLAESTAICRKILKEPADLGL
jgi:glutathione S-transferase